MTDASMRWETAIGFEPTGIDLVGEVAVVYRDAGAGPGTAVGLELSNHGDLTWRHQGAELLHRQGTAPRVDVADRRRW